MHWLGLIKGGPGSGNFGHAGRPGEVGGSAPDDGGTGSEASTGSSNSSREHGSKVRAWAREKFGDDTTAENFAKWFGDSKVVDVEGNPLVVYHGTSESFNEFDTSISLTDGRDRAAFFSDAPDVAATYAEHQVLSEKRRISETERALADLEREYNRLLGERPPEREGAFIHYTNQAVDSGQITREEYQSLHSLWDRHQELDSYTLDEIQEYEERKRPQMKAVYLSLKNPKIIDANGMDSSYIVPNALKDIDRKKHDGIIFRNIVDTGDGTDTESTVFAVFNPAGIKSATGNSGTFDPKDPNITKSAERLLDYSVECLGLLKGGPGSGNFGHAGRPGQVGGSAPDDTPSGPQKVPGVKDRESSRDLVMIDQDAKWTDATGERKVTVFHYSREDRTGTGLSRKYAGTAGAGREKESFEYENGKLRESSVPIHAYLYGATRESMIPSNVLHKIEAKMSVLDTGSQLWHDILNESQQQARESGRPMLAIAREEAVKRGYDALVSQRDGIMQILRDVRPDELEVVGKKKDDGKVSLKYKPEPPKDSKLIRDGLKRWEAKIKDTRRFGPEIEMYALQNTADYMVESGAISKEDRLLTVGRITGDDLPNGQAIQKKIEELKSKIKPGTSDDVRNEIDRRLKYSITYGKTEEQIKDDLMEQVNNQIKEHSKVAIRVPADIVGEILGDGRFKNQFETGTSQGALDEGRRKAIELASMGVPEDMSAEHRPIYGYLSKPTGSFNRAILEGYGGVAFILKDDVRERTTVTVGDSLDNDLPVSKPSELKIESIKITEPGLIADNSFGYIEAQIHGGVKIDDVEEVILSHRTVKSIINRHKQSREGAAGEFGGFEVLDVLTKESFKISIEGHRDKKTGEPTKHSIQEWVDSAEFKEFLGTGGGDAFLVNVEAKYGKETGSSNRPSWW